MKTLLLLRHAKSSWKDEQLPDHDRPLNKRGKHDAPRIGRLLQQHDLHPDVILSSTAKRARKTAAKVAKNCAYQGIIELDGSLYLASPATYIRALRKAPDSHQTIMLVGHNPGLEQLLTILCSQEHHLPTAALACLQLQLDTWHELAPDSPARLVAIWRPRELDES